MKIDPKRRYLGDGVYCETDGYHIMLQVEDYHPIYLAPEVFSSLCDYADMIRGLNHE